jgi:Zn-dependent M28 family amino/carboxypeptidase
LEFDIRNYFRPGPIPYHNVVASIKGSKYPDEYVILGAHIDAFDVASGGVDCGNGVSAVMEAARMLTASGAKPDRTILFILFGAEEFGLRGSKAWVKAHEDILDNVSMMFNRDSGPLPYVGFKVPKSLVNEYDKIAEPLRQLYPEYGFEVSAIEPVERPKKPQTADHYTFKYVGIPAEQMTMSDVKGYGFEYKKIWHSELDHYQSVIVEYQEQAAPALAIMALGTANLPKLLPREEVYKPLKK